MYGFSAQQIKTKGIISLIAAAVILIVSVLAGNGVKINGIDDILYLLLVPVIIAWIIMAFLINGKMMIKGFISPVPFVSYCTETIKAMVVMVPKALFWALSQKNV